MPDPTWGTDSEINFLNNVGKPDKHKKGSPDERRRPLDRKKCLMGYAKAFHLRVEWGSVRKNVVKEYVIKTLREEFGEEVVI